MTAPGAPRPLIFICYAGPDRDNAAALRVALDQRGERSWCDVIDLVPGDRWDEVIGETLAGAGFVVVLVSRIGSEHDGWFWLEEIADAIADARSDRKRIIPVKLDRFKRRLPYGLNRLVAIDAPDRDWPRVAEAITAAIERRPIAYRLRRRGWRGWLAGLLRLLGVHPIAARTEPIAIAPPHATAPAPLPGAEPPTLTLLRAQLRAVHGALVPFFQRDDDPTTLDDLYVELALDRARHAPDAPRELTLEALMRGGPGHRRHGRWAILGEPGAGKTTLARHLVWQQAATGAEPLALYIGLADWAEFQGDPFDYLEAELRDHHGPRAADLADILRAIAAEDPGRGLDRLWLIFDGFDEISPERVIRARERIATFAAAHPHLAIAVTSRPIGYDPIAGFAPARVQPLDPARRRALLNRWLGPAAGDAAFTRIEAQTALADRDGPLAGNPLLLSLLARLAADRPDRALPATRGELFGDAIELLLTRGHSPARRGLGDRAASARRLLAALALDLTGLGGEAWTRTTLADRLAACLDDRLRAILAADWRNADGFLDQTGPHAGILAAHDGANGRWRFLHRALRERLAAEALIDDGPERIAARIRDIADDPAQLGRWGETLGMACALLDDPTAPLRALQAADVKLTLRVLPELTGLPPAVALDVLWGIDPNAGDGWDGDTLLALARRWPADEAVARLTERVTAALDLDRLAFIHYALAGLGHRPNRAAFFARAGRPIERVPPLAMVTVPAGTFRMGSPDDEDGRWDDEGPQHRVILTAPYRMGATPVTRAEYAAFDPAHRCPGGGEHPVTEVSWWRAALYAAWADAALPTEAQWEHACRAGTTTRYWS
ncbi:MAG: SUMF1/EgtB/PvdO family nonheme iron enzyme, partial [Myxococcales bacterium]|nr:SUMF1/EgtB/PvdO family nonheme iron enzyme [Myxococcales bacterium]